MSTAEFLVLVAVVCIGFVIWKNKSNEKKQKYPTPEETPLDDIRKPDLTVSPDKTSPPLRSKDFANVEVPAEVPAEVPTETSVTEAVVAEAAKVVPSVEETATVDAQPKVADSTAKPKSSRSNKRRRTKP